MRALDLAAGIQGRQPGVGSTPALPSSSHCLPGIAPWPPASSPAQVFAAQDLARLVDAASQGWRPRPAPARTRPAPTTASAPPGRRRRCRAVQRAARRPGQARDVDGLALACAATATAPPADWPARPRRNHRRPTARVSIARRQRRQPGRVVHRPRRTAQHHASLAIAGSARASDAGARSRLRRGPGVELHEPCLCSRRPRSSSPPQHLSRAVTATPAADRRRCPPLVATFAGGPRHRRATPAAVAGSAPRSTSARRKTAAGSSPAPPALRRRLRHHAVPPTATALVVQCCSTRRPRRDGRAAVLAAWTRAWVASARCLAARSAQASSQRERTGGRQADGRLAV